MSAYVKIKIRKATFGKWWSPKQKRLAWLIWNLHINSRLNWPRFQKSANKVVTKEDSKKSLSGKEGDTSEIWSLNVNQDVSEASHTVSKWRPKINIGSKPILKWNSLFRNHQQNIKVLWKRTCESKRIYEMKCREEVASNQFYHQEVARCGKNSKEAEKVSFLKV